MSSKEYKISTLVDLLSLEDDQIDRLCAELPSFIKHTKAMTQLMGLVGESIGTQGSVVEVLSPLVWVDDGKQNISMSFSSMADEELFRYEVTSEIDDREGCAPSGIDTQ